MLRKHDMCCSFLADTYFTKCERTEAIEDGALCRFNRKD